MAAGEFRTMPSLLTARMILSMCLFWATAHEEMSGPDGLDHTVTHMLDLLTNGLAAERGS